MKSKILNVVLSLVILALVVNNCYFGVYAFLDHSWIIQNNKIENCPRNKIEIYLQILYQKIPKIYIWFLYSNLKTSKIGITPHNKYISSIRTISKTILRPLRPALTTINVLSLFYNTFLNFAHFKKELL